MRTIVTKAFLFTFVLFIVFTFVIENADAFGRRRGRRRHRSSNTQQNTCILAAGINTSAGSPAGNPKYTVATGNVTKKSCMQKCSYKYSGLSLSSITTFFKNNDTGLGRYYMGYCFYNNKQIGHVSLKGAAPVCNREDVLNSKYGTCTCNSCAY